MGCQACTSSVFWQKLGRCQRCIYQLSMLSPLGWMIWGVFYRHQPTTLEAITLFVTATCMTLLLLAHGIRAWQLRNQAPLQSTLMKKSIKKPDIKPGK